MLKQLSCVVFVAVLALTFESGCAKKSSSSSGGDGADSPSTAGSGTVALDLTPKEGADAATVANLAVTVVGHPEVTGTSDESGHVEVGDMPPGTLAIIVTSGEGEAALMDGAATYGLKFDEVIVKAGETTDLGSNVLKETGGISGVVSFYSNPNDLDLTGSDVFIPGTSYIAKTDAKGAFSLSRLPEGKYELRLQHTGFAPLTLAAVEVKEGKTTALGEVPLSLSNGPEGSIVITDVESIEIAGVATKVNKDAERKVKFKLTYDAEAALMKVSDEPSFLNKEWSPVAKTGVWTEFKSDGPKTLYVMFSDLNGLESSPYSDAVVVDTEVPRLDAVSLLNGWAQSAVSGVFVDIDATDSGSGVKEVLFSTDESEFTSDPVAFERRLDLELEAGDGPKTVYAKVRDFAGNESLVLSDDINLDTSNTGFTVIAEATYAEPVTLYRAQSPYLVKTDEIATFDSDLTIEPGTELVFGDNAGLKVKGVFTAAGTGWDTDEAITFRTETPVTGECNAMTSVAPALDLDDALPGVSNKNVISYSRFVQLHRFDLNGGTVSNNRFDASACGSGAMGVVFKSGLDTLTMSGNTYQEWDTAIEVTDGIANTIFKDNVDANGITNHVLTAIRQSGRARRTVFTGNQFEGDYWTGHTRGLVELANGNEIDFSGSTFSGTAIAVLVVGAAQEDVTVDGLVFDGCKVIAQVANGADANLTITNSTFDHCDMAIYTKSSMDMSWVWGAGTTVTFDHDDVTVEDALVLSAESAPSFPSIVFTDSNVNCIADSGTVCDLFYASTYNSTETVPLTMTGNNIYCKAEGANGCRGFTAQRWTDNPLTQTFTLHLDLDGNYWQTSSGGKAMPANLNGSVVESTSGAAPTLGAGIGAYHINSAGSSGTILASWPTAVVQAAQNASAGPE